jgi:hypothetical protein
MVEALEQRLRPDRAERAKRRNRELRAAAIDYHRLRKHPGWARLARQIEGDIEEGKEQILMGPTLPSTINPMGLFEVAERQREEWLAEARGMRHLLTMPERIVAAAKGRGLLDDLDEIDRIDELSGEGQHDDGDQAVGWRRRET